MVAQGRTVRLADGPPGAGTVESSLEPASDEEATEASNSLQNIVSQQWRQQCHLFHDLTTRLRRTNDDLQQLRQLRQTTELKHPPPWSPQLAGRETLLTDEQAWREYERRYLFAMPSVKLPPPQEVDIALLTARLTRVQPMLPTPGRTCAQGFFPPPGRGRLALNEPRPRYLLPGTRLPNTVIIRLLWSTRTLLDVQHYRAMENRRTRRRQHWEFLEWSHSEEEEEEEEKGQEPLERLDRLESIASRRRNERKISMTKHEHLENWQPIAASGVDEGAVLDSDDEAIARARQRPFSHRGRLLSELDGTPATEVDAYTPALGRFTCGAQPKGRKKRGNTPREGSSGRRSGRRTGDGAEGSLGEDGFSSGSSGFEGSDYDEDREQDDIGGEQDDIGGSAGARGIKTRESDPEHSTTGVTLSGPLISTDQGSDRQVTGIHPQSGLRLPPVLAADGQVMPGSGSASSAAAGEPSRSVPSATPTPWNASDSQPVNMPQGRRPSKRTGSVSRKHNTGGRMPMPAAGEKSRLNAPKIKPDIIASRGSSASARPAPRRQALQMPHLFEVKDYVCEDSKNAEAHATEGEMKPHGIRRFSVMQRDKQRLKSVADSSNVGRMQKSHDVWSSSRIPGIAYDDNASDDDVPEEESSDLVGETSKESTRHYAAFQHRSGLPGSKLHTSDEESRLHRLAVDYIQHLMQHEWAQELLHDVNCDTLDPWDAAERLVKRLAKQPFEIQQEILYEVQTIHKVFPAPGSLRPLSNGILAILHQAAEDMATLNTAMDTLVLLADQMDVVIANILTLLTLEKLDVTESIQLLLERLGLVDPHHVVLTEARSWAPRGRRRNLDKCQKEIGRKALSFVSTWTESFEAHSRLIAEEVNKKKMDAVVKYNIIKILKNYEPHAIEKIGDGFNVSLRKPSSTNRLKNPEVIEVLNYFIEMTDEEDDLHLARMQSVHFYTGQEPGDPLEWRRVNQNILVPPSQSPVIQGNRSLAAGVLQPTKLVTHWQGAPGLAPGPWPTVTVGIHLRIADKYYRGTQPAQGLPNLH